MESKRVCFVVHVVFFPMRVKIYGCFLWGGEVVEQMNLRTCCLFHEHEVGISLF